ncbi:SUF system Fe-S cluster assembly regulator [Tolypothrix campylonemoides VB511288]|nr:SUF system Fe-S cluster assembly regulator [Tolypothrix campylonemoides VB511288]
MLRVAKLTDYATLVLTVMAAEPDAVLSATGLAERAGLEATTVSKVLKPLAQAGLVDGFRGAHGGYRLARPPAAIGLIEIVEAMEGPLGMTECSVHDGNCTIEGRCNVRANWRRINDVVIDALRTVTLAQMLGDGPPPVRRRIDVRLATA